MNINQEELSPQIKENKSIQNQINDFKKSRDEKFKSFDSELQRADTELLDYKSVIRYQPLAFLELNKYKLDENLDNTLRCYEKMLQTDNNFCCNLDSNMLNISKEDLLFSLTEYMDTQFLLLKQNHIDQTSPEKNYWNLLESTKSFCYFSQVKDAVTCREFFDNLHSDNLKSLAPNAYLRSTRTKKDPFCAAIENGTAIDILSAIKKEYNLNNTELFHFVSNTFERFNFSELHSVIKEKNFFTEMSNNFCRTTEDKKLLDDILSKKLFIFFEDLLVSSEFFIIKPEIKNQQFKEIISSSAESGLDKSTALLARAYVVNKYSVEHDLDPSNTKTVYNNVLFRLYEDLENEIGTMLSTDCKFSDKQVADSIQCCRQTVTDRKDYYNTGKLLMMSFKQDFNKNKDADPDHSFFLNNIVPSNFFREFKYNAEDEQELAYCAAIFPQTTSELITVAPSENQFAEYFLNYGGSMNVLADAMDHAKKYNERYKII